MNRSERHHHCRCHGASGSARLAGDHPFALPGSSATYTPDRICRVHHIKVEVSIDFDAKAVDGVCTQTVSPFNDGPCRLTLDAVEMSILSVHLGDGETREFSYDGKSLTVDLGDRKEGEQIELIIRYHVVPRRGLYFIAPDPAYPNRPTQVWSQGQDEDNRCWFPCFDHPAEKQTSEVIATVPESMTVLSNGALVGEKHDAEGGRRTFHFRHDVAHSSYLITLAAGHFDILNDRAGATELAYYVPPDRIDDASRTFANTPKMIEVFEKLTGQTYPYGRYSQVCVAEFIFGGMENTSATTLTDQTLHNARAHLDFSSEPLISHELAHQWFGDLLTCRDWSEGWLNEGFATYLEILWREASAGQDEADYDRLGDQEAYLDEDAHRYRRPIVTRVFHEPIDVFDRHLYEKGGCVLHMLRHELGEARWKKAITHYVAKHKGKSVETRDLARAVDEATGWNPDRFFQQWVFLAGYPRLKAEYAWDDAKKLARLTIKQTQSRDKKAEFETPLFSLPLTLRFVVEGETHDVPIQVEGAQETFVVALAGKPAQVILDPGNHYLKTVEWKKADELWKTELASAEHGIDRVHAARALGKGAEPTSVPALATALTKDKFWAVRGESALALGQIKTQAALSEIIAAMAQEAHPKARRQMARAIGQFRHDARAAESMAGKLHDGDASYFVEAESASALAKTRAGTAFESLVEAMARPSYLDVIASACLGGLAELRDARGIDVALEQVKYGRPVVARRSAAIALGTLGSYHTARKRQVLEVLAELLEDPDFRVRIAAVEGLRLLGESDGTGALRKAERRDLDGRVRRRAREVIRYLGDDAQAAEQKRSTSDALEKLETENLELKERLAKIEARLEPK